jgi:hypothetical protein
MSKLIGREESRRPGGAPGHDASETTLAGGALGHDASESTLD